MYEKKRRKDMKGRKVARNKTYAVIKRILDRLLSFVLLTLLYPLMLVIGAAIRLSTGESAIFRQRRVGAEGRIFVCYKFRTMYKSAPSSLSTAEFSDAEDYITPIGRILRKSSLDELPQLFNVINGDMSLVGPRPLIEREREVHYMRMGSGAYSLRPGITGLAQIRGRDELSDVSKVYYDTEYAYNMSIGGDVRIILSTLFKVYKAEGVASVKRY